MQVQVLNNPTTKEFQRVLEASEPSIVYLQGEQVADNEEIGTLMWGDTDLSTPDALCGLFGSTLPTTVSDCLSYVLSIRISEFVSSEG